MMLELVVGGELFRLMHGEGEEMNALPTSHARFYAGQVAEVYEYIHHQNIVYRDLKPENLLIDINGYLKVIDWGFGKHLTDTNMTYTVCACMCPYLCVCVLLLVCILVCVCVSHAWLIISPSSASRSLPLVRSVVRPSTWPLS